MPCAARLIRVFTPSFGDTADVNAQNLTVKEVVARLDPQRFHVTLLCEQEADPRIVARPNTKVWQWRKRGNTLLTLFRMLADIPDIYFFPREGPLDARFFQLRRWLHWHTAVVTYMVSGGVSQQPPPPGQLRNLREANAVYGNCRYITRILTDKLGFRAGTIYDGIDRRYFFPPISRRDRTPLTVLFAGSFRPYKRVDLVIKQAAQWPEVQFRLCGRGEEEESCRRLASELGCSNVHFLGQLGQADLGEEMRNADVFLFPSQLEGHPQVLLQAAGCGLPSIAMSSYLPDAVVNGETGFLVNGENELSEKLDLLLADTALRARMSQAAVEHAAAFDWNKVATDWARAFKQVMGERA